MARKQKSGSRHSKRRLLSTSSKSVDDRARGRAALDDNRGVRFDSSATGEALERRGDVATERKLKVGLTFVLGETTKDVLAKRVKRHTWSRNGLLPRSEVRRKLKLTEEQRKKIQTPSYLR